MANDVVIVSADAYKFEWVPEGRVPYGTVFMDDAFEQHPGVTREQLREGSVPSVDWAGLSADAEVPASTKVSRGRPKKGV